MATIKQRVMAGAAFLDECWPGWERQIDLERLRLEDCQSCVLGQLYGEFNGALIVLGLQWPDQENLGFLKDGPLTPSNYRRLAEAWRALISERRTSDAH